jgi:hypothetical protein
MIYLLYYFLQTKDQRIDMIIYKRIRDVQFYPVVVVVGH